MKTLFGITLGPIYELLVNSEKTKELWFSSYFFSLYSKKLIEKLTDKEFVFKKPISEAILKYKPKTKAGFYPDHLIGETTKSKDVAYDIIENSVKEVRQSFVAMIDEIITDKGRYIINKTNSDSAKIITDYIQTSFVVIESDLVDDLEIIKIVDQHLNSLEKHRTFMPGKNENTCQRCLVLPSTINAIIHEWDKDKIIKKYQDVCPLCFLKLNAHNAKEVKEMFADQKLDEYGERPFRSIEDILGITEETQKDPDRRKNGYKYYVAMIKGDGDGMGSHAKKIGDAEKFSKMLFEFTKEVDRITAKRNGEAIFIGGDEFLVMIPFAVKEENKEIYTAFDFIDEIKTSFTKNLPGATISFGLNIAYYKYPLSYMLKDVDMQIEDVAKKEKNSIGIQLTQHSGQRTPLLFSFDGNDYSNFNTLLKDAIKSGDDFPKGIHHKISENGKIFESIKDESQFENYWQNKFVEHSTKGKAMNDIKKLFMNLIGQELNGAYTLYQNEHRIDGIRNCAYQIKFIKFLIGA